MTEENANYFKKSELVAKKYAIILLCFCFFLYLCSRLS